MAMGIVNETDDEVMRALVFLNYGIVYSRMNRLDKAVKAFEDGLAIHRKFDNKMDHAVTLLEYGKALKKANDPAGATRQLTESLKLFTKCDAKKWVKEVKDLLHELDSTRPPG